MTAENDAPQLADVTSPVTFLENTVNAAPQILDPNVTLSDPDSVNFDTGILRVRYDLGGGPEDQITINTAGNIIFAGGVLTHVVDGVIGNLSFIDDGVNGNDFVITFTALATASNIEEALELLAYQNTSDTPTASRTLGITVSDGDGGTSAQSNLVVNVTAENDAPQLADVTSPVTFLENTVNAAPQILDPNVTLSDPDSVNFDTGILRVRYDLGGGPEDQITINTAGNIIFAGGVLTHVVDGVIGNLSFIDDGVNGNDFVITFTALATASNIEEALELLAYQNTSDTPTASRTLGITVSDGDGGTSAQSNLVVNVTAENELPELNNVKSPINFLENTTNEQFQILDNDVTLTDTDSADFNGGSLNFTYTVGGGVEDQLTINTFGNITFAFGSITHAVDGLLATVNGLNDGVNGNNLIFDLSANATAANISEVIEQLMYQNISNTPAASRTLSITVSDGDGGTSIARDIVINVTPEAENTAPTASDSEIYIEQNSLVVPNVVLTHSLFGIDNEDDYSSLTFAEVGANANVVVNADGTFTYTAPLSFIGTETFQYQVTDSQGLTSAAATVTVKVLAETQVTQTVAGADYYLDLATNAAGTEIMVVWEADNTIDAASFDEYGSLISGDFAVETNSSAPDSLLNTRPAVAALGNGNYVYVWRDGGAGDFIIYNSAGVQQFAETNFSNNGVVLPDVTSTVDGTRFIIVSEGTNRLESMIYNNNGSVSVGAFSIVSVAISDPHVTALDNDQFAVTWIEGANIKASVINGDGTTAVAPFIVAPGTLPDIIRIENSGADDDYFFVTYEVSNNIFGRVYDKAGTLLQGPITITNLVNQEKEVVVTELDNGLIVVAWSDNTATDIYAQILQDIDPTAGVNYVNYGSRFTPQTLTANSQGLGDGVDIEPLTGGRFVIGWDTNINSWDDKLQIFDTTIVGTAGNDILRGSIIKQSISGGAGDDLIIGLGDGDDLDGGDGIDTVSYQNSSAAVTVNLTTGTGLGGDAAGDTLINIENIIGSANNDILTGDLNDNEFEGLGGADSMDGGAGGSDTVSYKNSALAVTIDLSLGTAVGGDASGDTFANIDNVTGSANDDSLTGDAFNNILRGLGGIDTLFGLGGDDILGIDAFDLANVIDGGAGTDTIQLDRNQDLDLSAAISMLNIEIFDLNYNGNHTIQLTAADVLLVTDASNTLTFIGDYGDVVQVNDLGWSESAVGGGFTTYTNGAATIIIEDTIAQTNF